MTFECVIVGFLIGCVVLALLWAAFSTVRIFWLDRYYASREYRGHPLFAESKTNAEVFKELRSEIASIKAKIDPPKKSKVKK